MDESQMDLTDQPKPAAFIGQGGAVAEAGFATAEPFIYEVEVPEWGKPVRTQLIHDTGFRGTSRPSVFAPPTRRTRTASKRSYRSSSRPRLPQQPGSHQPGSWSDTGWIYTQGVADFA